MEKYIEEISKNQDYLIKQLQNLGNIVKQLKEKVDDIEKKNPVLKENIKKEIAVVVREVVKQYSEKNMNYQGVMDEVIQKFERDHKFIIKDTSDKLESFEKMLKEYGVGKETKPENDLKEFVEEKPKTQKKSTRKTKKSEKLEQVNVVSEEQ